MDQQSESIPSAINAHIRTKLSGQSSVFTQTYFLIKKNLVIYSRHWVSTLLQIFSPIFIIGFLWMVAIMVTRVRGGDDYTTTYAGDVVPSVDSKQGFAFPRCVQWQKDVPCVTLAFAVNNNTFAQHVMDRVRLDAKLVDEDLLAFDWTEQLENFLARNPNRTMAAVTFSNSSTIWSDGRQYANLTMYTLYYNSTKEPSVGQMAQPVQVAIDAAIIAQRQLELGESPINTTAGSTIYVGWRGYPNPAFPNNGELDVFGSTGPNIFAIASTIVLLIATHSIVAEKENHVLFGMRVMGLKPMAYFISWAVIFFFIALLNTLATVGTGYLARIYFFTNSNLVVIFLLFFTFTLSLVCLSFLLSALIATSRVSLIVGCLILSTSFVLNLFLASPVLLIDDLYSSKSSQYLPILFHLYLPFNFGKVFSDINRITQPVFDGGKRAFVPGGNFSFRDMLEWHKVGDVEIPPSYYSLIIMVAHGIVYLILGWYLWNTIPQDGVARPPWFFLTPSYWNLSCCDGRRGTKVVVGPNVYPRDQKQIGDMNEDGKKQYFAARDSSLTDVALRIVGLRKDYRQNLFRKVQAVQGLDLVVPKGSCLALLGHNGAGKSTTFQILTGLISPTDGDCVIDGLSVRHDISKIRQNIGYCPQHDILLPDLTAWQHLELFGAIKGITSLGSNVLEQEIEDRLRSVNLYDVRNDRVSTFSGGMRRRLSLAIACLGNPKLLLVDEMTTGMDPISTRQAWQLIQSMKSGRCIVLTTHDVGEAEALADQIAIMASGKLQCIGDSMNIKHRFGAGHNLNIIAHSGQTEHLLRLVKVNLPSDAYSLQSEDAGHAIFSISPNHTSSLISFLKILEKPTAEISQIVKVWSISHTTLEEVYLKVTSAAGFTLDSTEEQDDKGENDEEIEGYEHEDKSQLVLDADESKALLATTEVASYSS